MKQKQNLSIGFLNFVFQFIKNTKCHFGYTDSSTLGTQIQLNNRFLYKNFLFYDDRIEVKCKNQSNFQITVVLKITFQITGVLKITFQITVVLTITFQITVVFKITFRQF